MRSTFINKSLIPWLIAFLASVFCCWIYFPGLVIDESVSVLSQAKEGIFGFPSLFFFLWRFLDGLIPGVGGIFVFQIFLFWMGLCFAVTAILPRVSSAFVVLGIGFFPPVFYWLPYVLKDVFFVSLSLWSLGLLIRSTKSNNKIWISLCLLLIALAGSFRQNGFFFSIPMATAVGLILSPQQHFLKSLKSKVLVLGKILLSILCVLAFYRLTTFSEHSKIKMHQITFVFDLSALSYDQHVLRLPTYLKTRPDEAIQQDIHTLFFPYDGQTLIDVGQAPDPKAKRFPFSYKHDEIQELEKTWFQTVLENPVTYLQHRIRFFMNLIGLRGDPYFDRFQSSYPAYTAEAYRGSTAGSILLKYLLSSPALLLFKLWPYLLLGLILVAFYSLKLRQSLPINWIFFLFSFGNLFLGFSYFFTGFCSIHKYVFPNIVFTLVLFIWFMTDLQNKKPSL